MASRRDRRQQQRHSQRNDRNQGGGGGAGRWIFLAVVVGVVGIIAIASVLLSGGSGGNGTLQAAPDFSLSVYQGEEVLGGVDLNLSDVTALGKPVVLNFWAGLCPPCRVEMPGFQRVHEARGNQITLLGVDVGPFTGLGSREDGIELLRQIGVTYPIASASTARSVQVYRVISMPTTVFITADGRIVRRVSGAISEARLNSLIDELIQVSQAPPPVEAS